jgi:hypothetical protein
MSVLAMTGEQIVATVIFAVFIGLVLVFFGVSISRDRREHDTGR